MAGDEAKMNSVRERAFACNPTSIVIPSFEIHIIACVLCGFRFLSLCLGCNEAF